MIFAVRKVPGATKDEQELYDNTAGSLAKALSHTNTVMYVDKILETHFRYERDGTLLPCKDNTGMQNEMTAKYWKKVKDKLDS